MSAPHHSYRLFHFIPLFATLLLLMGSSWEKPLAAETTSLPTNPDGIRLPFAAKDVARIQVEEGWRYRHPNDPRNDEAYQEYSDYYQQPCDDLNCVALFPDFDRVDTPHNAIDYVDVTGTGLTVYAGVNARITQIGKVGGYDWYGYVKLEANIKGQNYEIRYMHIIPDQTLVANFNAGNRITTPDTIIGRTYHNSNSIWTTSSGERRAVQGVYDVEGYCRGLNSGEQKHPFPEQKRCYPAHLDYQIKLLATGTPLDPYSINGKGYDYPRNRFGTMPAPLGQGHLWQTYADGNIIPAVENCPSGSEFCDVPQNNSLSVYVYNLLSADMTNGCLEISATRYFCPDTPITRGQVAKFVRETSDFATNTSCGNFDDVLPGDTFYEDITTLKCRGIVDGYSDGTFRPDNYVTRGELAKMVANAHRQLTTESPPQGPTNYKDVVGTTFEEDINYLTRWGIVGGYTRPDGIYFSPDKFVVRAETAKFVASCNSLLYLNSGLEPNIFEGQCTLKNAKGALGGSSTIGIAQSNLEVGRDTSFLSAINPILEPYWLASPNGVGLYYPYSTSIFRYTIADGLPSNYVTTLDITNDGTVWIGTDAGVASFDGLSWLTYPEMALSINAIAATPSNTVWASTPNGLAFYNGTQWNNLLISDYPLHPVLALTTDANGLLWGNTQQSVGYVDGTTWHTLPDLPQGLFLRAIVAVDQNIVLATASGLHNYQNGVFSTILPDRSIRNVSRDAQGNVWVFGDYGTIGIYNFDEGWIVPLDDPNTSPQTPAPPEVWQHLQQQRRLHWLIAHPFYNTGDFAAPAGDWQGDSTIINEPYTPRQSLSLQTRKVAILRITVQDEEGQDIGWELSDIERILNDMWDSHLPYTVLTETQLASQLSGVDVLIVPSFKAGYQQEVLANFSAETLTALHDFVAAGGSVYAQGNGAMILEAAEILPAGTVHPTTTLSLPPSAGDVGQLLLDDPTSPLFFNWLTPSLYLLQDPLLTVTGNLQTVASYSDTIGGPQPAIVQGTLGQGRILLVNGHPTAVNQEEQHILLFNALLQYMAEKGELFGRAYQVYTDTVPSNVIPAYEAVTVTADLTFANWWETAVLSDVTVSERVQPGFTVLITTIIPAPASVLVTVTDGLTETIITWDLGDVFTAPITLTYVAMTDIDALASGEVVFSRGAATYTDGQRQVTWQHPDFILFSAIAADLKGYHDNEPDRFYTIPAEGVYLDEHVALENIENTPAHNVCIVRYVPLITPIVGLEDQRQPLATNAGETVWMRNSVYGYKNYQLPTGMAHYTETWGIDTHWDGSTVITMTTPGGYHIDPIAPLRDNSGFFVTIPPTYSHAITVTADYELLLPAIRLDWCIGDFPAFWFELPAVRYGIHSQELFSRPVSFTGDPLVDTVVVDATGGSVYTGAGADHLIYRQFLPDAAMIVYTPPAPADAGLVYEDIWGRVHTAELRGNFYDVFNYASCACGDGMGERNAALNVTYGIHIDLDGDGSKETLLTDLEGLKGIMHTRLVGDLDIFIKSINYGNTVAINENVLEAGIFRGLGFTIRPREGTWEESYTATYSTIISNTRRGAYDFLVFEQAIPPQATNLITIHATLDPTANHTEGLLQLHQGARLVYRQNYAGEGQYEVYDSRTQVVQGLRTDVTLDSRAYPSKISTYSDTVYMVHSLNDAHAWQPFNQDPYFTSYGYGDAVASVYVGGRDKRELLYSIIELGERTWIRVELNNNTGTVWDNIQIGVNVPTGMTVTQLFGEQVPIDLWPDIPFLNATRIADASFGLYFFEIQTSETVTDLQGILHQLPITFSADGAPANFTIPPAVLVIKAADGSVPYVITGETIALAVQDGLRGYVTAEDIRLLTQTELNTLRGTINADTAVIPNTENALTYFQSISSTIPFTTVDGVLQPDLAGLKLPWFASGTPSPLHVVIQSSVEVSRSTRYPLNSGAAVTHTDGFGVDWSLNGRTLHVNAVGASLVTTYDWLSIVDLSTGDVVTGVVPNAWNAVTMSLQVENKGTDIATDITQVVDLVGQIELINAPSNITTTAEGLLWQVGDLGPGTSKTVEISFRIFVPNNPLTDQYLLLAGGQLRVIARTDADFINLYAGKRIVAQTGQDFYLPVAHYARASVVYLPLVHQLYSPPLPDLVVSQLSLVGGNLTLVVQNVGSAAVQTPFWVDVYLNPTTPPQAVNQTWEAMGAEGLVWAVDGVTLQPNQSLTLTIGDGYFQADRSHYPSLGTASLPIYAHVDSYNPGVNYGAVLEMHERSGGVYNNISAAVSQ